MIKDDILDLAIAIPRRFYKHEKAMYMEEVSKRFEKLGYKAMVQPENQKGKKIHNVIFGDITKAKVVILSHYDTPIKSYKPKYRYYPFSPSKNLKQEQLSLLIQLLIGLVLSAIGLLLGVHGFNQHGWLKWVDLIVAAILIIGGIWFFQSHGNKANMTKNSASVALMLDLAKTFKRDVAFVLLDQQADGYRGLAYFGDQYGQNQNEQIWIQLDCVAYGSTIVFAHDQANDSMVKTMMDAMQLSNGYDKSYSHDTASSLGLNTHSNMVCISVGDIQNHEFYVPYTKTKADVHIQIDQLIDLSHRLETAITTLINK